MGKDKWEFENISNQVLGCAIEVHKHLGPGLWSRHTASAFLTSWLCMEFHLRKNRRCLLNIKASNWTAVIELIFWWMKP